MTTLTEFLLARIAEDEAAARDAIGGHRSDAEGHWTIVSIPYEGSWPIAPSDDGYRDDDRECEEWTVHASRHDPARVLAECEAKRRIVETSQRTQESLERRGPGNPASDAINGHVLAYRDVVRTLASVYADHPDYRPEWSVR